MTNKFRTSTIYGNEDIVIRSHIMGALCWCNPDINVVYDENGKRSINCIHYHRPKEYFKHIPPQGFEGNQI